MSIMYAPGIGSGSYGTSARMIYIWDARSTGSPSYIFAYNSDPIPHLFAEQGVVAPAESYNFTTAAQTIVDPFVGTYSVTATLLKTATMWMGPGSSFSYDPSVSSSGVLIGYTTPLGGILSWTYNPYTYPSSGISLQEVATRTMQSTSIDPPHSTNLDRWTSCSAKDSVIR
jgi:hypothetical protein